MIQTGFFQDPVIETGYFPPIHMMIGTDPVSETLRVSSLLQIMGSVRHDLHVTNRPLSKTFRES
jgi:hypothetical protein